MAVAFIICEFILFLKMMYGKNQQIAINWSLVDLSWAPGHHCSCSWQGIIYSVNKDENTGGKQNTVTILLRQF